MPGADHGAVADSQGCLHTQDALWLLGSLAGFHRRPFDAELVIQRFPPPIDLPTLIDALDALGLKAGLAHWPEAGLSALPLPAVALLNTPVSESTQRDSTEDADAAAPLPPSHTTLTPALIVQYGDDILTWVKPGQSAPETVALDAARVG